MAEEVAIGAARRLSVDVANLSFRLALLESERELVGQMARLLTPGTWQRSMDGDVLTISGDDIAVVERIIAILQDVM